MTDLRCKADASGRWSVHGTLVNSTKAKSTYAISFDVINTKNGTVYARAQKSYVLAAGTHAEVTVQDFYRSNPQELTCVPNVQRADAH